MTEEQVINSMIAEIDRDLEIHGIKPLMPASAVYDWERTLDRHTVKYRSYGGQTPVLWPGASETVREFFAKLCDVDPRGRLVWTGSQNELIATFIVMYQRRLITASDMRNRSKLIDETFIKPNGDRFNRKTIVSKRTPDDIPVTPYTTATDRLATFLASK